MTTILFIEGTSNRHNGADLLEMLEANAFAAAFPGFDQLLQELA